MMLYRHPWHVHPGANNAGGPAWHGTRAAGRNAGGDLPAALARHVDACRYSATLALAGGTAPIVATWMVDSLGKPDWPAFYIMVYGVLGLLIMWPMR